MEIESSRRVSLAHSNCFAGQDKPSVRDTPRGPSRIKCRLPAGTVVMHKPGHFSHGFQRGRGDPRRCGRRYRESCIRRSSEGAAMIAPCASSTSVLFCGIATPALRLCWYMCSPMRWLDGFQRDQHPEGEVIWWERLARCYSDFTAQKAFPLEQEPRPSRSGLFGGLETKDVAADATALSDSLIDELLAICELNG
jgi:hypothetical protein